MKQFSLHPTLLFRTPLLPLNGVLGEVLSAPDPETQIALLRAAFQRMPLQEALFLASPVLFNQTRKWLNGEALEAREEKNLHLSLLRYLARMSARCTPFGLFAGCTVGEWGTENAVLLEDADRYARHTRPDMDYLCSLAQHLAQTPGIRERLLFYPNNSLYRQGDRYRYVQYFYQNKRRVHHIVAVDADPYLEMVLRAAQPGQTLDELARVLIADDESTGWEEARAYLDEMVDAQLLVGELDGNTTGEEMFERMLRILRPLVSPGSEAAGQLMVLERLRAALLDIDAKAPGVHPGAYELIAESLAPLGIPFELNRLFQTDMTKPARSCTLDRRLAGTLRRALEVANRLSPRRGETDLDRFKQAFEERYETKEIPLLEALDVETGIGYLQNGEAKGDVNPLVDDLALAPPGGSGNTLTWNKRERFLLLKLTETLTAGRMALELTDTDLEKFPAGQWDDVPDSLFVMGSVLDAGNAAAYPTVYLEGASGPATTILGRFTHADPRIDSWVRDVVDAEEKALNAPDTVLAEIVHLPESRAGNILMRTAFRAYEIPYLALSGVDADHQIPLQDLLVSVRQGQVVLRSKKLNKRVLPRLGNAHNYSMNALPVYHFLCDLQYQEQRRGFGFNWGSLAEEFPFLPRVTYQNVVLHRATWQFSEDDAAELCRACEETSMPEAIHAWRSRCHIPERVVLVEFDNELLIDFRNPISVQVFLHEIKNKPGFKLAEFLFEETTSLVKGPGEAAFTNQFVAVFTRQPRAVQPAALLAPEMPHSAALSRRSLPIGSEWLYYKLYCGAATADEVLCNSIAPLIRRLQKNGLIDRWFFIRYGDPKGHLRLRLRLTGAAALGPVVQACHKAFRSDFEQGRIWRIMTDTYERELERYGPDTMQLAEAVFAADSRTTLDFLKHGGRDDEEARWLYGLWSMDAFLEAFRFSPERKARLLKQLQEGFGREFGMGSTHWKQLNKKYQGVESRIQACLGAGMPADRTVRLVRKHVAAKQAALASLADELLRAAPPETFLDELLASYLHMLHNRLFKSKQRAHELVLYDFLYKIYHAARRVPAAALSTNT